jgi:S1-C subfamily serine protease
MMIENLTPQLGEFFGVKGGNGVLVRSVEKGSRAEQAGIKAGDVIVKINGSAVNDCSDFSRLLRSRTSTKATVVVMRDRREQTLTLNLPAKR